MAAARDPSFAPLAQSAAEAPSDDSSADSDGSVGGGSPVRSRAVVLVLGVAAVVLGVATFSRGPVADYVADARAGLRNAAMDVGGSGLDDDDDLDLSREGAPSLSEADDIAARDAAKQYATALQENPKPPYKPHKPELALPSDAPVHTFYVYRAQAPPSPEGDYPLANVNVASLGGVLWYLHDEVIGTCARNGARKFGITRIRRFKITTKATAPLWAKEMNFGLKCSFDSGECTGPHYDHVEGRGTGWHAQHDYDRYGFYVGCNNLGEWPHSERIFQRARNYPNAIWYSLPGPCPTTNFHRATDECRANLPGGLCKHPDGRGNCTYSIEEAGEIDIDTLVGITPKWKNRGEFCRSGAYEGRGSGQINGRNHHWWDKIWDAKSDHERTAQAEAMFKAKYPNSPDLPPPKCDVSAKKFYR